MTNSAALNTLRAAGTAQEKARAKQAFKQGQAAPIYAAHRKPKTAPSRLICNASSQQRYPGHELAPYQGRPGSLDHLALPSRAGNTLHYREPHSIQTVRSIAMPAA